MAKSSGLSSDIDVIKEFEELKLKQKLLIESLKRNGETTQNKLFLEINSKLDFLVKIFMEANNPTSDENAEEKIDYEAKFKEVLDKVASLGNNFNDRLDKIESKISSNSIPKIDLDKPVQNLSNNNSQNTPEDKSKVESKGSTELNLPPAPDFETKIEDLSSDDAPKKKKKWF